MKKIAIDACETDEEKHNVKDMTLEKLHDFGVLCRVGRNPYPTHCFDLLTDNTNKAAKVQCALFKGTTRDVFIDRKEFNGPIYEQVDDAYNFVLRHIDMGAEIEGVYRKDVYELPISAIREIIANAILHRSYLDKGKYTIDEIGEGTSDSAATIKRFLRLSYLSDDLLDMVDEGIIGLEQGLQMLVL